MNAEPRTENPEPSDLSLQHWWTRNHAGRALAASELAFLGALSSMLDTLAPPQVDPALCAITVRGASALIALIPHRHLGGLTLVATMAERFVAVSWTSISDLDVHDDLDLTREVYLYTRDEEGSDAAMRRAAVRGVREQLGRPIVLRLRSTRRGVPLSASCWLRSADGELRRIARLPPRASLFDRLRQRGVRSEIEIRFTDRQPPPYAVPSFAGAWFRAHARVRRAAASPAGEPPA
ncbi:MAG TPA: hypothetical protein VG736_01805 [Vicinamibacterales bacterium]|jgi:hypothetical protein|nr:hypothetical protein [Vicinamibacterales bacterium]